MRSMIVTKCLHVYCGICSNKIFDRAAEQNRNKCTCPMCRTEMGKTEVLELKKDKPLTINENSRKELSTKVKGVIDLCR